MCSNMPAFLFIDKDTTRSTCSAKAEVLKFLLWVSDDQTGAASRAMSGRLRLEPLR